MGKKRLNTVQSLHRLQKKYAKLETKSEKVFEEMVESSKITERITTVIINCRDLIPDEVKKQLRPIIVEHRLRCKKLTQKEKRNESYMP